MMFTLMLILNFGAWLLQVAARSGGRGMQKSFRFPLALLAVIVAVLASACEVEDRNASIPSVPTAASFLDDSHGWIGAADGIWYTEDGGKTWTRQFPSQEPVIRLG